MKRNTVLAKLLTPELKQFSNRHLGESCYVFGDGASVKWFDLTRFSDRPAICCGMIPFHMEFSALDARYLSIVAPMMFAPKVVQPKVYHEYRVIAATYASAIRRLRDRHFFLNLTNRPWLRGANVDYVFKGIPRSESATDALLADFDLFSGSFHASLTLAYFLGFRTTFLVGFDAWTLRPARSGRWYEFGPGEQAPTATGNASAFLEVLRRDMDIRVVTLEGAAQGFDAITYDELTGAAPRYRENDSLMERKWRDVMATCSLHRVFP